jgi:integrase
MIQAFMNDKRKAGLSARTVQYHHAVLRRALGQAERWGKVPRNVARLVSPPKVERPEVRPLTPEQAQVLLKAVAGSHDSALYACAIGLGLRQGELLGLGWEDINLEDGTLSVRRTLQRYGGAYHLDLPKTDRSRRTLGLPAGLVQSLGAHRNLQLRERMRAGPAWQGDEWNLVFCTEVGAPMPGNYLTHRFQALLASLHLPKARFHDLRHASATYMIAQGVDLRVVMEVLGHSQIHVTANTYAHVRVDATRAAAENVDALLSR